MYYEINVSKKTPTGYSHLFATHKRSILSAQSLKVVYKEIASKFPAPEYHLDVMRYIEDGTLIDKSELE